MEKKKVHRSLGLGARWVWVLVSAIAVVGCRTSKEPEYAEIPDLPGTPVGGRSDVASVNASSSRGNSAAAAGGNAQLVVASKRVNAGSVEESPSQEAIRAGEMLDIVYSDTQGGLQPAHEKVRDDGTITLMFDKSFKAAGKTPGELAREIRKVYVPDYFQQLTVSIIRPDIRRTFFVDGEVRAPSKQEYSGAITVTQAITSAGGFTDFADKRHVKLIRADGKIEIIDCKKALKNPKLDLEVMPRDKVVVPRSIF